MTDMIDDYEVLRNYYCPDRVRTLFIGESRPAGGTFFFLGDSKLYRYTKEAIEQSCHTPFSLLSFKLHGCWFYDVCQIPVNGMARAERRTNIMHGTDALKKVLAEKNPKYVVVVKKGDFARLVFPHVLHAGFVEGQTCFLLPFPACSHQLEYVDGLASVAQIFWDTDN